MLKSIFIFSFSFTVKGFSLFKRVSSPERELQRPWHKNEDKAYGANAVWFIMALARLAKLLLCLVTNMFWFGHAVLLASLKMAIYCHFYTSLSNIECILKDKVKSYLNLEQFNSSIVLLL